MDSVHPLLQPPRKRFAMAAWILPALWSFTVLPVPARADFFAEALPLMVARFGSVNDYHCQYSAFSAKDGKTADLVFTYFFKKPKQIRMEVVKGTYPGTVLLYHRQHQPGKVKVRVGSPLLAAMQKAIYGEYFDHRDQKVTDLGGFGVLESDWGWFLDIHAEMARFGRTESVQEVVLDGRPCMYYELVSSRPEKTMSVAREELWIDKETFAPVRFVEYDRSGTVIRKVEYKEMAINVGLRDELFTKFEAVR